MSMRDAVQYARKMRDHYLAFEEAEKMFEAAAQLEQRMAELKAGVEAAMADYTTAKKAADEIRHATAVERAKCEMLIRDAHQAVADAEAARDKTIADAHAAAEVSRKAQAEVLAAFKTKCANEMATLGKEVAALRDERDALLKAIAELKRLAAR